LGVQGAIFQKSPLAAGGKSNFRTVIHDFVHTHPETMKKKKPQITQITQIFEIIPLALFSPVEIFSHLCYLYKLCAVKPLINPGTLE
jgi:hypothetical protein